MKKLEHSHQKHHPRKRFGQNFLRDAQVIQEIIAGLQLKPDDKVVEIGPGLGALTKPLLNSIHKLEVIEFDRDLVLELKQFALQGDFQQKLIIHEADALKFDYAKLAGDDHRKIRLIGNLPYNISTPLIFHLLKYCSIIHDMHFMLQQEVVDRMAATPNHKSYGKLSVMIQYACKVQSLFSVSPQSFYPKPKVQSAIVRLLPYASPPHPVKNLERLREITGAAFNQRRKTLSNSLKAYLNKEDFTILGIDSGNRPEQLTVEEFVRIANYLEARNAEMG